jgi:hypothetical protein
MTLVVQQGTAEVCDASHNLNIQKSSARWPLATDI